MKTWKRLLGTMRMRPIIDRFRSISEWDGWDGRWNVPLSSVPFMDGTDGTYILYVPYRPSHLCHRRSHSTPSFPIHVSNGKQLLCRPPAGRFASSVWADGHHQATAPRPTSPGAVHVEHRSCRRRGCANRPVTQPSYEDGPKPPLDAMNMPMTLNQPSRRLPGAKRKRMPIVAIDYDTRSSNIHPCLLDVTCQVPGGDPRRLPANHNLAEALRGFGDRRRIYGSALQARWIERQYGLPLAHAFDDVSIMARLLDAGPPGDADRALHLPQSGTSSRARKTEASVHC